MKCQFHCKAFQTQDLRFVACFRNVVLIINVKLLWQFEYIINIKSHNKIDTLINKDVHYPAYIIRFCE